MTKKRLSLILIMESSRFVIEKKKRYSLCQLRDRARANAALEAGRDLRLGGGGFFDDHGAATPGRGGGVRLMCRPTRAASPRARD